MKHYFFIVALLLSLQVSATENPFDEKSFETATKSDTEELRSEIEMLRNEISAIQNQSLQSGSEGSNYPEAPEIMAEPLMVINGNYFVRPVMGGLPKKVSPEDFNRIAGEGY